MELETARREREALEQRLSQLEMFKEQTIQTQATIEVGNSKILQSISSIEASLKRLEKREKNELRSKLIDLYRLFTNPEKNPKLAWTEMEHKAFFLQVKDYEDLGGNDYVHSQILPAVNMLTIIPMTDLAGVSDLMASRKF